ncbi:DMT family transporter [Nitratidesulfovibrio liaohensis]|uniref:DMT family transporter n=1 Tax=Nitratidesulfovibrio liaohensis TaxID=2604158 RepID=A0ABY9R1E5_9BACT|nr:DMT family transporter [Nitratidesulfovibrio liaohensis]WMW65432.1 DMT family transporter [Nitratidesulfovibrio liaohensis]
MFWTLPALLAALLAALDATLLRRLAGDLPPPRMVAYPVFWSLPPFLALLAARGVPDLPEPFWLATLAAVPVNMAGHLLTAWAVRMAPVSRTIPYLCFSPVFVVVHEYLLLGVAPRPAGGVGVLLVVAGSWVLNAGGAGNHGPGECGGSGIMARLVRPFRTLAAERGARVMLGVALLWGLGSVLNRQMVLHATPALAGGVFFALYGPAMLAALMVFGGVRPRMLVDRPLRGAAMGAVLFLAANVHFTAMSLTTAANMIAVKRLDGVFAVLFDRLSERWGSARRDRPSGLDGSAGPAPGFLGSPGFPDAGRGGRPVRDGRLTGASLMAAGAALVVLAS